MPPIGKIMENKQKKQPQWKHALFKLSANPLPPWQPFRAGFHMTFATTSSHINNTILMENTKCKP